MSELLVNLDRKLKKAVAYFWSQRVAQRKKQGGGAADNDRGKHLDGFGELVATLLEVAGLQRATIYLRKKTNSPGWSLAERNWDLVVVADDKLVAFSILQSQTGPFDNHFNHPTDESLGIATDLWAAYAKGAFKLSERPWLGYFMLLEEAPESTRPVRPTQPHFEVFPEFESASYAERYDILITKLVRSRLYDAGCFLLSPRVRGLKGVDREPNPELSFNNFAASLFGRAVVAAQKQPAGPPAPPKIEEGPAVIAISGE